ncbi:MAG: hypothetical protein ABFE13_17745 [Phycisphaerales bacterium]
MKQLPKLPADVHPGVVQNPSPLLNPARKALTITWDTWAKLTETEQAVADKRRFAPVAQQAAERALSAADKALSVLAESRTAVGKKIAAVVCPPTPDPLAAEIRAHFKAQPKGAGLFGTLGGFITKGDRRTCAAIFNAPAYLSGLTDEQHATLIDIARRQWCPEDVAAMEAMTDAAGRVKRAVDFITSNLAPFVKEWTRDADAKALEGLKNA